MNTFKLVVGILSIVLALFVLFQSCTAGVVTTLSENTSDLSASAGLIVAISFLVSGIIAVAARKSKGGTITAGVIYLLSGLIGIGNKGIYGDLQVWSWLAIVLGVIFFVSGIRMNKNNSTKQK